MCLYIYVRVCVYPSDEYVRKKKKKKKKIEKRCTRTLFFLLS